MNRAYSHHFLLIVAVAIVCAVVSPRDASAQTIVTPSAGTPVKVGHKTNVYWTGATVGGQFVIVAWYGLQPAINDTDNIYSNLSVIRSSDSTKWTPRFVSNTIYFGFKDPASGSVTEAAGPFVTYENTGLQISITGITSSTSWRQDSAYDLHWSIPNQTEYSPDELRVVLVAAQGGDTSQLVVKELAASLDKDARSFHALIPHVPTTHARIQVSTTDNVAFSRTPWFEIRGAVPTITHPLPGETIAPAPTTVTWSYSDQIDGPQTLMFSRGGAPLIWDTIGRNLNKSTRSFGWTPNRIGSDCYLRLVADSGFVDTTMGPFTVGATGVGELETPRTSDLSQNFPNPFSSALDNSTTTIAFSLPRAMATNLRVLDLLGRTVAQSSPSFYDAGPHAIKFDASGLLPGVYGYQIGGVSGQRVMMYVR